MPRVSSSQLTVAEGTCEVRVVIDQQECRGRIAPAFNRERANMKFLVIGAGMQARAVAYDLVRQADINEVRVADIDGRRLRSLKRTLRSAKVLVFKADAGDRRRMTELMKPCDVAVSCVPYFFNLGLARAAVAARTHFCDLGGNNDVVHRQLGLSAQAKEAGVTVVPDCGLAPGMVSILAVDGFSRLERTDAIHIRVGGLPRKPKAGQRRRAQRVAIVGPQGAADLDADLTLGAEQPFGRARLLRERVAEAIMPGEIGDAARRAVPGKVGRCGTDHEAVRCELPRHHAGVAQAADTLASGEAGRLLARFVEASNG